MTLFAGILQVNKNDLLFDAKCKELVTIMRVNIGSDISFIYKESGISLIQFDAEVFQSKGVLEDNNSITIIAGDPIATKTINHQRFDDLKAIHSDFGYDQISTLKSARGVFCGINYNKKTKRLKLFTDKLGIRPLYYYIKDGLIIFSTVFSYFKQLSFVDKNYDFKGLCETLAFKFCLQDRTVYSYVKLMNPGEYIDIYSDQIDKYKYYNWAKVESSQKKYEKIVKDIYDIFVEAIELRLNKKNSAIAFLSGGLDSRCVTSVVESLVEKLYTFNFSINNSQNKLFAQEYAKSINSTHHNIIFDDLSFPNWTKLMVDALGSIEHRTSNIFWSGDGGSVGVGCVYLNKEMTKLCLKNDLRGAVKSFLSFNRIILPQKLFAAPYSKTVNQNIEDAILEEISQFSHNDIERKLWFFLMFNDQRRHLSLHFETIGEHKSELLLPFFDSDFLKKIISIPMDKALYHSFYMDWFDHFPKSTKNTPWQTYPGHNKCPLEKDSNLIYQWNKPKIKEDSLKTKRQEKYINVMNILKKNDSKLCYINKINMYVAAHLHRFGFRDCSYIIFKLNQFYES